MAANRPPTKAERARVLELHGRGFSRNAIAADLGRSHDLVDRLAREQGLTFDRTMTEAATRARKADLAARRADLSALLLEDAERLRSQVWQPCTVFNFGGKDNTFEQRDLDQPPAGDKLKLLQAVRTAVDKSLHLAEFDTDRGGDAARSLLGALAAALLVAVDEEDEQDQGDEPATP